MPGHGTNHRRTIADASSLNILEGAGHGKGSRIRQFTVQRLRDYFRIDVERYGYKHYMTAAERKVPLKQILDDLAPDVRGRQR